MMMKPYIHSYYVVFSYLVAYKCKLHHHYYTTIIIINIINIIIVVITISSIGGYDFTLQLYWCLSWFAVRFTVIIPVKLRTPTTQTSDDSTTTAVNTFANN